MLYKYSLHFPRCAYNTIRHYGLRVDSHEDWTLPEIFASISKGYPIIVDILWDPSTTTIGHFVVVYGVDLAQEIIFYHDPYRGRALSSSWDEFASLWEVQVDVGDPLKPEGHRFWGLEIRPYAHQNRIPIP
jgi:hypothetical protein